MNIKVFINSLIKTSKLKLYGCTFLLATSLCFSGCSSEEEVNSTLYEMEINEEFMPFVREDGKIMQALVIKMNNKTSLKFGYFETNEDESSLLFRETFTGKIIDLTYIKEFSSNSIFASDDAANFFTPEHLINGGISMEDVNKFNNYEIKFDSLFCINFYDKSGDTLYYDDIYMIYFDPTDKSDIKDEVKYTVYTKK